MSRMHILGKITLKWNAEFPCSTAKNELDKRDTRARQSRTAGQNHAPIELPGNPTHPGYKTLNVAVGLRKRMI